MEKETRGKSQGSIENYFKKGKGFWTGKKRPNMSGKNHPLWTGGMPKCAECGKQLNNRKAKYCHQHKSTPEVRQKQRESHLGKNTGELHPLWKKEPSYRTLHMWVTNQLGKPNRCDHCGNEKLRHRQYHWANRSKTYKRLISDWLRLCAKCHKAFDKKQP